MHTPSHIIDLIVSEDVEDEEQRQPRRNTIIDDAKPKRQLIDLTIGSEHCCLCPNVLGEGGDVKSAIYVFKVCGCVCKHASWYFDHSLTAC